MSHQFLSGLLLAAFVVAPAAAQSASVVVEEEDRAISAGDGDWRSDAELIQAADYTTPPSAQNRVATAPQAALSASRLLAGVREYPDVIIKALRTVAQNPDLVRRLADNPGLVDKPAELGNALTPEVKTALDSLRQVPDVLRIAAEHIESSRELRALYADAPEGMTERLKELRLEFLRSSGNAAGEWQRMLASDPAAFAEYRALLDGYSRAQQQKDEHFPVVYALKADYYFACPPDAVILDYAASGSGSSSLMRLMETWYEQFGPEARDAAILREGTTQLPRTTISGAVGLLQPDARRAMWSADKNAAGALGMIPVVSQPLTDQPIEARLAFAVYEHARLWSGPPSDDMSVDATPTDVVAAPRNDPAPQPVIEPPTVVEPPPVAVAPQSAPIITEPAPTEPVITEIAQAPTIIYEQPVVEVLDEVDYGYAYDTVAIGGYYGSCYTTYAYPAYWPSYYAPWPAYYGSGYWPSYYGYGSWPSWGFSFGFGYSGYGYRPYCRDVYRSYYGSYCGRPTLYGRSYYGRSYYGRSYYGGDHHGYSSGRDGGRGYYDSARDQLQRRAGAYGSNSYGDRRSYGGRGGSDGGMSRGSGARSGDSGGRSRNIGVRPRDLTGGNSGRARGNLSDMQGSGPRREGPSVRSQSRGSADGITGRTNARSMDGSGGARSIQRSPRSGSSGANDALRSGMNRRSLSPGGASSNSGRPQSAPRIAPRNDGRSALPRITSPNSSSPRSRAAPSISGGSPRSLKPGGGGTSNPLRSPRSMSPSRGSSSGSPSLRSSPSYGGGSRSLRNSPSAGGSSRSMRSSPSFGGGGSRSMRSSPSFGGGSRSMRSSPSFGGGGRSMGGASRGGGRGGSRRG